MLTKDLINPKKWWAFVKFKVQEYFGYVKPEDKQWQAEVIVYRSLSCPACKAAGQCICIPDGETEACGCNWAGKSGDMSMDCSCEKWFAVNSKEDWEAFKKSRGVKFKLEYGG